MLTVCGSSGQGALSLLSHHANGERGDAALTTLLASTAEADAPESAHAVRITWRLGASNEYTTTRDTVPLAPRSAHFTRTISEPGGVHPASSIVETPSVGSATPVSGSVPPAAWP